MWQKKEVISCEICGCKTNKWEIGGHPGKRLRFVCPGFVKYPDIHINLQGMVDNSDDSWHPQSYIKELKKEIARIRAKYFDSIPPDIEEK